MSIYEELSSIGEYYAAGLFKDVSRTLFYRKAYALKIFYERCPLHEYKNGKLYPSGTCDNGLAVFPYYLEGVAIDSNRIKKVPIDVVSSIKNEFGLDCSFSSLPVEHTVAGNMYTHSMPHYKRIAAQGLDSYIPRINKIADKDIREGLLILVEGIRTYVGRIISYLRSLDAYPPLIEALERVPFLPARNIYEALVCHNFIFYLDSCDNAGCLASDLMPYYNGEDITELLREFYDNIDLTGAYSMSLGVDYSPLSVQCLEAVKGKRRPMIELFINDDCPDAVWDSALDAVRTSGGQPAFYNYEKLIGGLGKRFPEIRREDLDRFCGGGCTESMLEGLCCVGSLDAGINLPLIFTEVLDKYLESSQIFDEFYTHYINRVQSTVDTVVREIAASQKRRSEIMPLPMRTLLVDDCIDNGKDFYNNGARYSWSIVSFAGMINVLDSMLVIKKYIYEEKILSAGELLSLLARNDEDFLERARKNPESHGVDNSDANALAKRLSGDIYSMLDNKKPYIGLGFIPASIMFNTAASAGKDVRATPDGRRAGDPLAESLGAISAKDVNGPTAMLKSVTALSLDKALGVPVVNLTVRPDFSNEVLRGLIKGYFDLGGIHLQISCVSKQMLEEAYADPEKHRNLVVRVGGYSEYFHKLSDDLKRLVIARIDNAL